MKYKAMVQTFSIETGFLKSEYEVLKKIGTYQTLGEGRFRWTFPLALWDQVVVALGGQVVEFDQDHLTRDVLSRCVALKKEVELTLKRHGKGKITVMVEEEYYRLSKPHDGSISVAIVSKALVEVLWDDVVSKMPKGEPTPAPKVAERIVHSLGKHRWDFVLFDTPETDEWVKKAVQENRWSYPATGNFNWKYFEGDRKNYFRLYYDPVKVLQALGMVTHTSRGFTTRLIDEGDFDDQTRFAEMRIHQGEVEAELSAPEPPSDRGDILAWAKRM